MQFFLIWFRFFLIWFRTSLGDEIWSGCVDSPLRRLWLNHCRIFRFLPACGWIFLEGIITRVRHETPCGIYMTDLCLNRAKLVKSSGPHCILTPKKVRFTTPPATLLDWQYITMANRIWVRGAQKPFLRPRFSNKAPGQKVDSSWRSGLSSKESLLAVLWQRFDFFGTAHYTPYITPSSLSSSLFILSSSSWSAFLHSRFPPYTRAFSVNRADSALTRLNYGDYLTSLKKYSPMIMVMNEILLLCFACPWGHQCIPLEWVRCL